MSMRLACMTKMCTKQFVQRNLIRQTQHTHTQQHYADITSSNTNIDGKWLLILVFGGVDGFRQSYSHLSHWTFKTWWQRQRKRNWEKLSPRSLASRKMARIPFKVLSSSGNGMSMGQTQTATSTWSAASGTWLYIGSSKMSSPGLNWERKKTTQPFMLETTQTGLRTSSPYSHASGGPSKPVWWYPLLAAHFRALSCRWGRKGKSLRPPSGWCGRCTVSRTTSFHHKKFQYFMYFYNFFHQSFLSVIVNSCLVAPSLTPLVKLLPPVVPTGLWLCILFRRALCTELMKEDFPAPTGP